MSIEMNNKMYEVSETEKKWRVKRVDGALTVIYEVSKADCPTWEDVELFLADSLQEA